MSNTYTLCVIFDVKQECADEFAGLVHKNIKETRNDRGVVTFNYHQVIGTDSWVLYETGESKADSDAHQQKPDVQEFVSKAPHLLAAPPIIYSLEPAIHHRETDCAWVWTYTVLFSPLYLVSSFICTN